MMISSLENGIRILVPTDKYKVVFLIFLLNGIGTLLPWNMLINAESYFLKYKLPIINGTSSSALINYHDNFLSYIGIASKAPNILLQIVNLAINSQSANFSLRIYWTLIIQIAVFLVIIFFACINTSTWPEVFFWLTMIMAAFINFANGIYQGCVYGLAARFPMKYTNSITLGMNISGTIASILSILSIMIAPSIQLQGIIFFACAVIILSLCLIFEFTLQKNHFYRFYAHPSTNATLNTTNNEIMDSYDESYSRTEEKPPRYTSNDDTMHRPMTEDKPRRYDGTITQSYIEELKNDSSKKYLYIFKKIWVQLLNIILVYFVSLSIFPALAANVKRYDESWISETYFTQIFCFLSFNVFATTGNFIAQYIRWPGPKGLIVPCALRLLFIPFFLLCNYYPTEDRNERVLTVLFHSDAFFIIGMILMAVTSGYTSSLAMMYIPRCVHPEFSATAGMFGALIIILGILAGLNFSLVYSKMIHINL